MKKSLLLLSLGCIPGMMLAEAYAPKVYDTVVFQKISPDGKYIVSELYGQVQIFDIPGNQSYDYFDETGMNYWTVGIGNAFSKDNILVGSAYTEDNTAYWQNGEWHSLPLTGEEKSNNLANGITADGSRICGTVSIIEMTFDDATMTTPVMWQRTSDGTYGNYIVLPHPDADYSGRAPQYITAISISDDGKTIAGTVTDCIGRIVTPIVYKEDEDGKWSYTLPMEKFINPNHLEIPENPGEYPQWPNAEDYMTPEEVAAYAQAYQEWAANYYQGEMPEITDYMTAEEKAQYETAYAEWQEVAAAYEEKQTVYLDAIDQICNESTSIIYNNILVNAEGTKIAVTAVTSVPDPTSWIPGGTKDIPHIWVIDLESGDIQKYEDAEVNLHGWYPDGTIVGWGSIWADNPEAYLLNDGKSVSYFDYLVNLDPEIKEWVEENTKHITEIYDWENDEVIEKEEYYVGLPLFSADMKTLACWTPTPWDYEIMYQAYVFDLSKYSGVKSAVATGDLKVAITKNGDIVVNGVAATLEVYNLQGVCVASANNVSGITNIALEQGVYVVKATSAEGVVNVAKVVK